MCLLKFELAMTAFPQIHGNCFTVFTAARIHRMTLVPQRRIAHAAGIWSPSFGGNSDVATIDCRKFKICGKSNGGIAEPMPATGLYICSQNHSMRAAECASSQNAQAELPALHDTYLISQNARLLWEIEGEMSKTWLNMMAILQRSKNVANDHAKDASGIRSAACKRLNLEQCVVVVRFQEGRVISRCIKHAAQQSGHLQAWKECE